MCNGTFSSGLFHYSREKSSYENQGDSLFIFILSNNGPEKVGYLTV